jgi:Domain of unknown function (DUF3883)
MNEKPITKRALQNVGQQIWSAIDVMEKYFGGQLTHDSGHGKGSNEKATTWILTFPDHGDAQIAVPMNKSKFSLLMRSKTVDGQELKALVGGIASIEKTYTNPREGVASSLLGHHARFLNPSSENPLLRVNPFEGAVRSLLEHYLGNPLRESASASKAPPISPSFRSQGKRAPLLSEEDLKKQLDRQSEIGRAGEFLVIQEEIVRLRECGCPTPENHVHRIAASDVGRGYDIESTWPGQERCIEVKTTTRLGSDFFLTANERQVLTELGDLAWLYRVVLDGDGNGAIEKRVQNPMESIPEENQTPVVWRIKDVI